MFLQLPFISFDIHTLSLENQTSWHKLMQPNSQHDQNPHKIPGRISCIPCFYEIVVQVVYSEDSPITCSLLSSYTYSREEEPWPCSFRIGRNLHCFPLQWKTQSVLNAVMKNENKKLTNEANYGDRSLVNSAKCLRKE